MADSLESSITTFLRSQFSEFALMVNGPWGCGKTYFWKNKAMPAIRKSDELKESYKSIRAAYVSLYGVSDVDSIALQILVQLHTKLEGRFSAFATGAARAAMTWLKIDGVSKEVDLVAVLDSFSSDDLTIICFDDLERSRLPIDISLGLINQYVEHTNTRVVILCNEDEIAHDQNANYGRLKEKTIGATFRYRPQIGEAIRSMIDDVRDQHLNAFLNAHIEPITRVFRQANIANLRILRHSLSILSSAFFAGGQLGSATGRDLVLTVLPLAIEYISRELPADRVERIALLGAEAAIDYDRQHGRVNNSLASYFHKYELRRNSVRLIKATELARLVITGTPDNTKLQEEIAQHQEQWYAPVTTRQQAVRDLTDYFDDTDEQFNTKVALAIDCVRAGEFVRWSDLLDAAFQFELLDEDMNILSVSGEVLRDAFRLGIRRMAEQGVDLHEVDGIQRDEDKLSAIRREVYIECKKLRQELKSEEWRKEFFELLSRVHESSNGFSELIRNEDFRSEPIPATITAEQVFEHLKRCNEERAVEVAESFRRRHHAGQAVPNEEGELQLLSSIAEMFDSLAESFAGDMVLSAHRARRIAFFFRDAGKGLSDSERQELQTSLERSRIRKKLESNLDR